MATKTTSFGTSKREGHDASDFYSRNIYRVDFPSLHRFLCETGGTGITDHFEKRIPPRPLGDWSDRIYCQTAEDMHQIPDWEVPPESARRVGHPAPFPVELAGRVVRRYSYIDDVVHDPFCGSGTTCVAAKRLNRHWVGYDVVPGYCTLAEEP